MLLYNHIIHVRSANILLRIMNKYCLLISSTRSPIYSARFAYDETTNANGLLK